MKRKIQYGILVFLLLMMCGCGDRIDIENITLGLMQGLDLDDEGNIIFYLSSPVFSSEAKEKREVFEVQASTMRKARDGFDAMATAIISSGKSQCILLGKKVLQHPDWLPLVDIFFRDSKYTFNTRVIVVDGSVKDLMFFSPKDKPRLDIQISKLIDTSDRRNITTKTTLIEFQRQMLDKGMTPFLPEIKKEKNVVVKGTALLDKKEKYATLLDYQETKLLILSQHKDTGMLSYTLNFPNLEGKSYYKNDGISFYINDPKRSIKTRFKDGIFHFDIQLTFPISITEQYFGFDIEKQGAQLEKMIDEQFNAQYKNLFTKLQEHKVDPVGLGDYARAYQFDAWKKVQDHWDDAFAKADINVTVHVDIKSIGSQM